MDGCTANAMGNGVTASHVCSGRAAAGPGSVPPILPQSLLSASKSGQAQPKSFQINIIGSGDLRQGYKPGAAIWNLLFRPLGGLLWLATGRFPSAASSVAPFLRRCLAETHPDGMMRIIEQGSSGRQASWSALRLTFQGAASSTAARSHLPLFARLVQPRPDWDLNWGALEVAWPCQVSRSVVPHRPWPCRLFFLLRICRWTGSKKVSSSCSSRRLPEASSRGYICTIEIGFDSVAESPGLHL